MKLPRLRKPPVDEEVDSELAFHLEMTTRELIARGMAPSLARAEAERRFGDARSVNVQCRRYGNERDRNARRAEYFGELRQDLAFAARQLLRAKSFTAIAVITLALGIGATAAMFSALDAVVLKPLPFAAADRVVNVRPTRGGKLEFASPPEFFAMRRVPELARIAVTREGGGTTLDFGGVPEMVDEASVSADYFAVFGVAPMLGRTFTAEEDAPGANPVAVLSHRFWVSHFNADPAVLNRVVSMQGVPTTIIGVMPASFDYVRESANIWQPIAFGPANATQYGAHYLRLVARLRAGVTIEQAREATLAAERSMVQEIPHRTAPLSDYGIAIRRFGDDLIGDYRALLFILLGAVGFVLLIACGNVANLLLARGTTRARELAIRAALGAGRARLIRQLLTESLMLALGGATAGFGVAFVLLRTLRAVAPENTPRIEQASIDWRVFGFTLVVGVVSSVLFGLAPALRAVRARLEQTLRDGGRGSGATRDRLRPILVGAQVALTLALLVGAGLLMRSAWAVQHVDPGFEPRGLLTARIVLPELRYATGEVITRALGRVRDESMRIPGVRTASLVSVVPMSGSSTVSSVSAVGQLSGDGAASANLRLASDGYFQTMQIPVLAGRDLARTDDAAAAPVVVVNEALAHRLWPGLSLRAVLGHRLNAIGTRRTDITSYEIVGVVGNLHDAALSADVRPEFYLPYQQTPDGFWPYMGRSLVVVLRTAQIGTPPQSLKLPLQHVLGHIDSSLPISDAKTMEEYLEGTLATARMNTILLSTLGGIALVLAMVGIFGVVSYFVSQRTQEIGVRIALGATPALVWGFVVRRGMTPIMVGLVAGVALSFATSTLLRGQLFGVTARDPFTVVAVGVLLVVVAMVAMYVPARRAMRVAPIVALGS